MTDSSQPVIGIPFIGKFDSTYLYYANAVSAAGGLPERLDVTASPEEIDNHIQSCDGFILMGGADLNPSLYGGVLLDSVKLLSEEKQTFFMTVATRILRETDKPVLGTCLGEQTINIIFGGTLYEDILTAFPHAFWHPRPPQDKSLETMHEVRFEDGSILTDIIGRNWLCVNSSHHQAVKTVGKGLKIIARANDGIVEGITLSEPNGRFVLGVQWHPERLYDKVDGHLAIFQALVKAARKE